MYGMTPQGVFFIPRNTALHCKLLLCQQLHRETHLPKVVLHSGEIAGTYRDRRVVERRQQIGPDIIDFCGGLPQRVYNIPDMFAVKLMKTLLDSFSR